MTSKQAKLLALLSLLDKTENFYGILDDFLEFVNWNIFARSRIYHFKRFQLGNISRFYVVICRVKGTLILLLAALASLCGSFLTGDI